MLLLENIKDFDGLIKENQKLQKDEYIIKNRGFITASKLKDFMKSPEYFFRKYILEQYIESQESISLKIGTAIDYLISYGQDKFDTKYFMDEGLLKPELEALALKKGIELAPKETVASLREKIYNTADKIRLTAWEGKTVKRLYKEFLRQPIFDNNGGYEVQKKFTAEYKSLKLLGTLDRFKLEKENENVLNIAIRDTKTCANIKRIKFEAVHDWGYDFSISFYNLLAILELKRIYNNPNLQINSRLILDVCQTSGQFPSWFYEIPAEVVANQLKNKITPVLEDLNKKMENWEKNKDPKVWLDTSNVNMEDLVDLDLYSEMETTLMQNFELLN